MAEIGRILGKGRLRLSKSASRVLCCSAAAVALAFTLSFSPDTQAAVIYTDLSASPEWVPYDLNGMQVNLVTGAMDRTGVAGWDWNAYFSGVGLTFVNNTANGNGMVGTGTNASALSAGTLVSSASSFVTSEYVNASPAFNYTGSQYLGLKLYNESTGQINYGWLLLSTTYKSSESSQGSPAYIHGFAYENTGAGITVGAVPEPSRALLFIAGLVGTFYRRRRRE